MPYIGKHVGDHCIGADFRRKNDGKEEQTVDTIQKTVVRFGFVSFKLPRGDASVVGAGSFAGLL